MGQGGAESPTGNKFTMSNVRTTQCQTHASNVCVLGGSPVDYSYVPADNAVRGPG